MTKLTPGQKSALTYLLAWAIVIAYTATVLAIYWATQ